MDTLFRRLARAFPFLGTRAATEDDLFTFCADRSIELVFSREVSEGIYVMFAGDHFIFLNGSLRGMRLLHVAFHEIGHYLLHAPSQQKFAAEFFSLHAKQKSHCEAEAVAALLLLPPAELHLALQSPDVYATDDLRDLTALRLDLWSKFKI